MFGVNKKTEAKEDQKLDETTSETLGSILDGSILDSFDNFHEVPERIGTNEKFEGVAPVQPLPLRDQLLVSLAPQIRMLEGHVSHDTAIIKKAIDTILEVWGREE